VRDRTDDGSPTFELSFRFLSIVRRKLVHGSLVLSEAAERGSFRPSPLIRRYVRNDEQSLLMEQRK
jgi:hypothetical protein